MIRQEGPVLIWSRPLADGSLAFAVFNIGTDRASLRGLQRDVLQAGAPPGAVARDLWAGRTLKSLRDLDGLTVPSHGVLLLRLKRP